MRSKILSAGESREISSMAYLTLVLSILCHKLVNQHAFTCVVDWEPSRAECMQESLELGNKSLCGRDVVPLVLHISARGTDCK